jgi:hypothetical protein
VTSNFVVLPLISRVQDLNGNVLDTYVFERLSIHDATVTEDHVRLLAVGTLLKSEDGYEPSKCRAEKRIIGKHPHYVVSSSIS